MARLRETPSQTAGPYVHIGAVPTFAGLDGVYPQDLGSGPLYEDGAKGERITIRGRVIDGTGTPLLDGIVEIWQADADGLYNSPMEPRGPADPKFKGWGRAATMGTDGVFTFETIKPGRVPWPDGRVQAPHVALWIVARGINIGLHTRMYFPDEAEANANDPVLGRIEQKVRRDTLVAERRDGVYVFDIHLQGEAETVFLDI
ncbi:protocatechuate 3,4-dioxygenase subunit alpha [Acuticoccus sp. I52.16.1]|uniref:protocatechuate 3,4-dioxygenase subunit alpha n=1 Tax=Acuticoccus sp. I52.16.1 TaxID=2928472 RepID=UPI001FD60D9B|nr:protocatechuate 3,4-dioxygenase subunit alpha [Acuticoccus sp. I52.16.1]UOM34408.1 protocatechuate 3,4-dioxygenase subunit alpha [Acuticoccus sp. I52.16.1]